MSNTDDDWDIPPTGGFHVSQDKTYDLLAAACKERNLKEVQRLALMALSWFNGVCYPFPSSHPYYNTVRDRIAGKVQQAATEPFATCPACGTEFAHEVSWCDNCEYKVGEPL